MVRKGGVLVRIHADDVDFQTPAFIIDNDIVLCWHGSLAPSTASFTSTVTG